MGLPLDVFGLAGRLDKIRAVRRELVDQLDGLLGGELPVQVHHQFHVRSQAFAQHPHFVHDAFERNRCRVFEGVETA